MRVVKRCWEVPETASVTARFYHITDGWSIRKRAAVLGVSRARIFRINHGSPLLAEEYVLMARICQLHQEAEERVEAAHEGLTQSQRADLVQGIISDYDEKAAELRHSRKFTLQKNKEELEKKLREEGKRAYGKS